MDKIEKLEKLNKAKAQQITKLENMIDDLNNQNKSLEKEIKELKISLDKYRLEQVQLRAKLNESHELTKIVLETKMKPFIKVIHNDDY